MAAAKICFRSAGFRTMPRETRSRPMAGSACRPRRRKSCEEDHERESHHGHPDRADARRPDDGRLTTGCDEDEKADAIPRLSGITEDQIKGQEPGDGNYEHNGGEDGDVATRTCCARRA